jgi:hypothetical protein
MRNAASLHVGEALVGIAAEVEVGIDHRSAPVGRGLRPDARRGGRCQGGLQKSSSSHDVGHKASQLGEAYQILERYLRYWRDISDTGEIYQILERS